MVGGARGGAIAALGEAESASWESERWRKRRPRKVSRSTNPELRCRGEPAVTGRLLRAGCQARSAYAQSPPPFFALRTSLLLRSVPDLNPVRILHVISSGLRGQGLEEEVCWLRSWAGLKRRRGGGNLPGADSQKRRPGGATNSPWLGC